MGTLRWVIICLAIIGANTAVMISKSNQIEALKALVVERNLTIDKLDRLRLSDGPCSGQQ